MTAVATHSIQAGELDVHYLEAGAGRPIVLLHPGTATAEMAWSGGIELLADRYRVLAPDTRGHGRTGNPAAGPLSYDQLADDVAAFVAALALEHPIVAGYSDGAQTALEVGLRHPGVAGALVLGGTMSEPTPAYLDGIRDWGFLDAEHVDRERIIAELGDDVVDLKAAHGLGDDEERWHRFLIHTSALWHSLPTYTPEQLMTITDPTLVLTGDRDALADLDQAQRLLHHIPNAELGVIPGAEHGAADRAIYWALVTDFLDRLD